MNNDKSEELKIIEKVMDNLDDPDYKLTAAEKDLFREGSYEDQMKAFGEYVGIPFKNTEDIPNRYILSPRILMEFYKQAGGGKRGYTAFSKIGIPAFIYYMNSVIEEPTEETLKNIEEHPEVVKANVDVKVEFNADLHRHMLDAHRIRMMFGDLDFLGKAHFIKDEEQREKYTQIGDNLCEVLRHAIKKNDAKVDVLMKIFAEDSSQFGRSPFAQGNAKRIAETGANTYNYYDGQHCGIIFTDDLSEDYKKQLANVVDYINLIKDVSRKEEKIKELSKATGLTQKKIREVIAGKDKLKHWEVKAIEHFYRDVLYPSGYANGSAEDLDPKISLLNTETKIYYTLFRNFYRERNSKDAEEPQMHDQFWAGIFIGWDAAADHMNLLMDTVAKGEPIPFEEL